MLADGSVARLKIKLSLACGDYDRTRALIDGTVQIQGINFIPVVLSSPERHKRMLKWEEFDVCELSMSSYLIAHEQNRDYVAIPVFPHRRFRHGYLFVRKDSEIKHPLELAYKRIGVRRFQNTAGLWLRGILEEYYGVKRENVQWFTEDDEELDVEFPSTLNIRRIRPEDKNLDQCLLKGSIDALIYPQETLSLNQKDGTRRLFDDYTAEEMTYFKTTGIFPIMHTIVIHKRILDKYPWVALETYKAFCQAKEECSKYLNDQRKSSLIWHNHYLQQETRMFGGDPWSYNLKDNEKTLHAMIGYSLADGLIKTKPQIHDLFASSTLEI
jgi:4,5-dihydroxyphthalate decarboxylase